MATTWNPSDKGANITLSNGNLSTAGVTAFNSVRATTSKSTGKWYWENKVTAVTGAVSVVGFGTSGMSLTNFVGATATSAGIQTSGTTSVNGITNVNVAGVSWSVNDVMNFAIDYDAGKIWLGKNGTWVASGNPASGTNPWCTFTANTVLSPAWSSADASNTGTADFGATAFAGTIPSGFLGWDPTLIAAVGTFSESGQAATFSDSFVAAVTSYALTGVASTFKVSLAPSTGSFVETGQTTPFAINWINPSAGSYLFTGIAAPLIPQLVASSGVFLETIGSATSTIFSTGFSPGAYSLSGASQMLTRDFINWLPANGISASWTGESAPSSSWTNATQPTTTWTANNAMSISSPVSE